jgi:hypothetical protein
MKLEPGERSILASFSAGPQAETALAALKQAGFEDVQLDRVGRFGYAPDVDGEQPIIAGKESSQAHAVLAPALLDDDTAILMAATPEASGLAGDIADGELPFLVTIVTTDGRLKAAMDLVHKHGGRA